MKRYVVIVAGGKGTRMGGDVPKQFLPIGGRPVLMRTLERFHEFDPEMHLVVVLPADQQDYWRALCERYQFDLPHALATGGATRFDSSRHGQALIPDDEAAQPSKLDLWLEKHLSRRKEYLSAHPEPTPEQVQLWKSMAESRLPALVSLWAAEMCVSPCGIRVTAARTRFGSCSAKGRLCFSLYLMAYPDAAIEYVVVHELAHLRHHDHSPAFYAEVERYLPDWRQRRELLRR